MGNTVTAKNIATGGQKKLAEMVRRGKNASTFLRQVAYPSYQEYQANRWMSENDGGWKRLDSKYAKSKLTRFAAFPGSGTKMLIATGKLVASVIGPSDKIATFSARAGAADHRRVIDDRSMKIYTSSPYAVYVDEAREFTHFDRAFFTKIRRQLKAYLGKGVLTRG